MYGRIVGEEFGKVVLMDLLAEGVGWRWRMLAGYRRQGRGRHVLTRTSSRRHGSVAEM